MELDPSLSTPLPATTEPDAAMMHSFRTFKLHLDQTHEARERVVKASRDITAASKKIIFALQRIKECGPVTGPVRASVEEHLAVVKTRYRDVLPDIASGEHHSSLSAGNEEFVEAAAFLHYVQRRELLSLQQLNLGFQQFFSSEGQAGKSGSGPQGSAQSSTSFGSSGPVASRNWPLEPLDVSEDRECDCALPLIRPEDYLFGICDLGGEIMRLIIGNIAASSGPLPGPAQPGAGITEWQQAMVDDIRALRLFINNTDRVKLQHLHRTMNQKLTVLDSCVAKVENAVYGFVVRRSEAQMMFGQAKNGSS